MGSSSIAEAPAGVAVDSRRWFALALIVVAQFMVVLEPPHQAAHARQLSLARRGDRDDVPPPVERVALALDESALLQ